MLDWQLSLTRAKDMAKIGYCLFRNLGLGRIFLFSQEIEDLDGVLFDSSRLGLQISMSPTYCKRAPEFTVSSLSSLVPMLPNKYGQSLKPCGRTVYVNCWVTLVVGSFHSKAYKNWDSGCKWMQRKASLRSKTVNQAVSSGIWARIMYGLGTTGCKRKTVLFMIQRSCIILKSLFGFSTGKIGVFHGEWHGTDYKDMFQKFIYEELDALLGFWFERVLAFTWEFNMVPKRDFYWLSRFCCPKPGVLLGTICWCGGDCVRLES